MATEPVTEEQILDEAAIAVRVEKLTRLVLDASASRRPLAFVGIHRRGVTLAQRVLELASKERTDIEFGPLDISLYRDDFDNLSKVPKLLGSEVSFELDGCNVVLFDDVLFSGRTTRAAINTLMDFGRPARIDLAVLVDRGCRQLPFAATFVGEEVETSVSDYVNVRLKPEDDEEAVYVVRRGEEVEP